jgi:16S rRNA G966 N2-methylase RsmD
MDKIKIRNKFGADYHANDTTYRMGIDVRFANHIASRFRGRVVLETCTGGGFTAIALSRVAIHIYSVEIDKSRAMDAAQNAVIAHVAEKITFIHSDIYDLQIECLAEKVDAALIDPDWADSGEDHQYRFINSNTRPPSDKLLAYINRYTPNITLIQPPLIKQSEFCDLPNHECERLYLNGNLELYCLHFEELAEKFGNTEFRI